VSQQRGRLTVDADLSADSLEAASLVQSTLNALRDDRAWQELEPVLIRDEQIAAWSREMPALDAAAWRRAESSDARWFWGAVLLMIGVESVLRRSRETLRREERARAA
jgi:hypothetical protein